jgi:hypothetical protein
VLGETLRAHHPNWTFWLCLPDIEPPGFVFDVVTEPIDEVVRLEELGIENLRQWLFKHDVVELCTAVKGQMLKRLFNQGIEKVIYLDPDVALFAPLDEVDALLDNYDIILTPHQIDPDTHSEAIIDNEVGSLKFGTYNLGFLAVANRSQGRRFAQWWASRTLQFCYDDLIEGLFTDQRWCDLVPAFFDRVCILRNPGYNVASWNLSRRRISIDEAGRIMVGGHPLRFFHFTKIDGVGQVMLEKNAGGQIEVFELVKWYLRRLEANAANGVPKGWWAYGTYYDGTAIPKAHRVLYRKRAELSGQSPDPFVAKLHVP